MCSYCTRIGMSEFLLQESCNYIMAVLECLNIIVVVVYLFKILTCLEIKLGRVYYCRILVLCV